MPAYMPDKADTMARLGDLQAALRFAEYELHAAIRIVKAHGATWAEIGEALGYDNPKVNGFRYASRHGIEAMTIELDERERLQRLLGMKDKATRYEVREIESGRVGITSVKRRTLSTHLSREVAEDRARKRGRTAEVWQLDPDGKRVQLDIRPPQPKRIAVAPATIETDEVPF